MKQVLEFEKPLLKAREELEELRRKQAMKNTSKVTLAIADLEKKVAELQEETYAKLSARGSVCKSRATSSVRICSITPSSVSTSLSNCTGTGTSVMTMPCAAGFATLNGQRVMLIGQQKAADTKENLLRNFGSAHPEGYRKALRLMRMAEKVWPAGHLCMIDTPGAFPGIGAEERNIAEAIAFNLLEMMKIALRWSPWSLGKAVQVGLGIGGLIGY